MGFFKNQFRSGIKSDCDSTKSLAKCNIHCPSGKEVKKKKIRELFSEVINSARIGIYHDSKFSSDNEILRKASRVVIMERRKTISQSNKSRAHRPGSNSRFKFVLLAVKRILLRNRSTNVSPDILSSARRNVRYQVMYLWGGI